MLTIRKEQLTALERERERQFACKMIGHLRQQFPTQTEKKDDDELLADVRQGVRTSAKYGISAECDVARYIEYMMIYGLSFDSDQRLDWAGKILKTEEISGSEKLDRIDGHDQFLRNPT
jgi:hypothetical protein